MTTFQKTFYTFGFMLTAGVVLIAAPELSHAATITPAEAQTLSAQLSSVQSQLAAASTTNSIILSPGQSAIQATSSAANGVIHITYVNQLQENPDPTVPPINAQQLPKFAEITLQYSPCIDSYSTPGFCMTTNSSSSAFPVMTSELPVGGSTGYLNSLITLGSLGTSTASFTFSSATSLSTIQSEIQTVAAEVHALLGQ